VLLLCPELYGPLRAVGQQFHASADGLAAAERILAVLDEPATVGWRVDTTAQSPQRPRSRASGPGNPAAAIRSCVVRLPRPRHAGTRRLRSGAGAGMFDRARRV
jgi:ABC-type multidrug transport system fused ATPase/permease subunit